MAQPAALPSLPRSVTRGHEARHLLALPGDVAVDEIEVLALSRFVATRWQVVPHTLPGADVPVGRMAGPGEPGELRLSRHSSLRGPYAPAGDGFDPGLPPGTAMVFDVVCPRERWADPPPPGGGDKDGIARAFPAGLPNREEERVVTWLVAAARRLGGAARFDVGGVWSPDAGGHAVGAGVLLAPDPGAAVNLTVYSDVWLDPQACHRVVQSVHPRAVLATEGAPYQGPPPGMGELPAFPGEEMDAEERRALHAAADDYDIAALTGPAVLDGYGITIDLGPDGWVAAEVAGEEVLPLPLRELPWVRGGCVSYRIVWYPPDVDDANREHPSHAHLVARRRAAELVARVARALWDAAGGEIADESDFLIDPEDL